MSPTLIGLAGLARSGKGSCADVFREEASAHGLTYKERLLSGQGKRHLAQIFQPGISEDDAIAFFEKLKSEPDCTVEIRSRTTRQTNIFERVSIRGFMQQGIQDLRDNYGEDFWTDILLPVVDGVGQPSSRWWQYSFVMDKFGVEPADICVVSDVRQVNECERIKSLGGVIIEVIRPAFEEQSDSHITEQRLPVEIVDHTLVNDVDINGWRQGCKNFFNQTILPKVVHG